MPNQPDKVHLIIIKENTFGYQGTDSYLTQVNPASWTSNLKEAMRFPVGTPAAISALKFSLEFYDIGKGHDPPKIVQLSEYMPREPRLVVEGRPQWPVTPDYYKSQVR